MLPVSTAPVSLVAPAVFLILFLLPPSVVIPGPVYSINTVTLPSSVTVDYTNTSRNHNISALLTLDFSSLLFSFSVYVSFLPLAENILLKLMSANPILL